MIFSEDLFFHALELPKFKAGSNNVDELARRRSPPFLSAIKKNRLLLPPTRNPHDVWTDRSFRPQSRIFIELGKGLYKKESRKEEIVFLDCRQEDARQEKEALNGRFAVSAVLRSGGHGAGCYAARAVITHAVYERGYGHGFHFARVVWLQ